NSGSSGSMAASQGCLTKKTFSSWPWNCFQSILAFSGGSAASAVPAASSRPVASPASRCLIFPIVLSLGFGCDGFIQYMIIKTCPPVNAASEEILLLPFRMAERTGRSSAAQRDRFHHRGRRRLHAEGEGLGIEDHAEAVDGDLAGGIAEPRDLDDPV